MTGDSNTVSLVDEQNVELKPDNRKDIKPGEPDDESQIPNDRTDGSNMLSLVYEENAVLKPEQNEAMVTQHEGKDENSQRQLPRQPQDEEKG